MAIFYTLFHKDNGKLLVSQNIGVAWRYFPSHDLEQVQHLNHLVSFKRIDEVNQFLKDCIRSILNPDWTPATIDKLAIAALEIDVSTSKVYFPFEGERGISVSEAVALEGRRSLCDSE